MGWVTRSIFVFLIALFLKSAQSDDTTSTPEDFSFCHTIEFKHQIDNCTNGGKYPILGNCTSYFKCDGMPSGAIFQEADTFCSEGQFFDRKKLDCVEAKSVDLEFCDQKTCETVFQTSGVEKLQEDDAENKGKYQNQAPGYDGQGQRQRASIHPRGQQSPDQYPPPNQGHQGQHAPGDDSYKQPQEGPGYGGQTDPNGQGPPQKPYPGGDKQKDQEKPREDKNEQKDKQKDSKRNGSSVTSDTFFFVFVFALVTCYFMV